MQSGFLAEVSILLFLHGPTFLSMVQFNLGHHASVRWHLCCHLPAPPRLLLLSCRQSSALRLPGLVLSGYQGHWVFPVLSLTSSSLSLLFSPCVLAFTETGSNPSVTSHVMEAWSEGHAQTPEPALLREDSTGQYLQVIDMEHFTENMLGVC